MIYHLMADTTGVDSIQDIIDSGDITVVPIPNVEAYETICEELLKKVGPNDSVGLDTVSQMGAKVRGDIKVGPSATNLYEQRKKFMGDTDNWGTYTAAANIILRPLMNLHSRGAHIYTTVHEEERQDMFDMRTKRNIGLNTEFRNMLNACSSDIFRITELGEDRTGPDGRVLIPRGTRLLQIQRSEEIMAKLQVPIPKSKALRDAGVEAIVIPEEGGWAKMVRVIGKVPRWLTLYGLPGSGKTSFVCRRGPEIAPTRKEVEHPIEQPVSN